MISIAIIAFFAGALASSIAHQLFYRDRIVTIKQDAKNALADQATESYGAGWMRCYADEVVRRKKAETAKKTPTLTSV